MKKYILIRLLLFIVTFAIIVSLAQILFNISNYQIWIRGHSLKDSINLAYNSYKTFFRGVLLHNDWGSYVTGKTVWQYAVEEIPTTIKINAYAFIAYVTLGIFFGIFTAVFHNSIIEKIVSYSNVLFGSVPEYISIGVLVVVFSYMLGWFPHRFDPSPGDPWSFIKSIILPITALSLGPILRISRLLRGEIIETLESEYVLLVRTKGFNRFKIIMRHTLRNSLIPVVSELPFIFAWGLSVSFIIERAYNIRGAAYLLYRSVMTSNADGSYVQIDVGIATLIVAFYILFAMIVAFIADFSLALLDPRIKIGGKK